VRSAYGKGELSSIITNLPFFYHILAQKNREMLRFERNVKFRERGLANYHKKSHNNEVLAAFLGRAEGPGS
jgi:hypothetical protein